MYGQLKKFRRKNDNSNTVPLKDDKKLNLWIRTQRRAIRNGTIVSWKITKLQKVELFGTPELSDAKANCGQ